MKKELPFITVAGHYGGDQYKFPRIRMRGGGCSTVCACHAATLIALSDPERRAFSPLKSLNVTRKDFNAFGVEMFPYVHPGFRGMPETAMFRESFGKYADSVGCHADYSELQGTASFDEALAFIENAIASDEYVQYLLLRHQDKQFDEIEWHWFTITAIDGSVITFSSFGEKCHADLRELWDTGFDEKGGLIIVK